MVRPLSDLRGTRILSGGRATRSKRRKHVAFGVRTVGGRGRLDVTQAVTNKEASGTEMNCVKNGVGVKLKAGPRRPTIGSANQKPNDVPFPGLRGDARMVAIQSKEAREEGGTE